MHRLADYWPDLCATVAAVSSSAAAVIKVNQVIEASEMIIHGNLRQVITAFIRKQPVLRVLQVVKKEQEMKLFANIENDFVTAGKWAEKELDAFGGILEAGVKQFCNQYGPIVLAATNAIVPVLAEYATGMSGADKFKVASASIGKTLEQQGIQIGVQVGTSMINSAIEHVVASLPPAATPVAQTSQTVQVVQSTQDVAIQPPAAEAAATSTATEDTTTAELDKA